MNNIASFARIQYYGDGSPDPRTATCEQHKVAAPYSDTAKGDGITVPVSNGWACTVCPMPNADLIGTEVILTSTSGTFVYAGIDPTFPDSIRMGFGFGRASTVQCDVSCVAPVDTPINEKDPRITIEKLARKRDYQDGGVWLPHIDYADARGWRPTAKKTKREALEYAARRLAIDDFHAARNLVTA